MLAEFAARMNCGGADVGTTASFMREMMHSVTRGSYDNVIATQTFADDTDEMVHTAFQHWLDTPYMCTAVRKQTLQELQFGRAGCLLCFPACPPLYMSQCHQAFWCACAEATRMSMQAVGHVFLASPVY